MIEEYLRQIDELLSASPTVRDIEVIRRTLRDTEWEKVLHYRYRVLLTDGGLVEMRERLVEMRGMVTTTKYRHHWQDSKGRLLKRWDNAPHHPGIETAKTFGLRLNLVRHLMLPRDASGALHRDLLDLRVRPSCFDRLSMRASP